MRIAIVDALRNGEATVSQLCQHLNVEQAALSQQLAVLRHRNIVAGRKEGLNVHYSVRDTTVFKLLDVAKQIFHNQLIDVKAMLSEIGGGKGRR